MSMVMGRLSDRCGLRFSKEEKGGPRRVCVCVCVWWGATPRTHTLENKGKQTAGILNLGNK